MAAYVQDHRTGEMHPIEEEAQYPNDNIMIDGVLYSHVAGMDKLNSGAGASGGTSTTEPVDKTGGSYSQWGTAPDGVPVYQDGKGGFYTKNPDGSWNPIGTPPAEWATGATTGSGNAPPPPSTQPGLIDPWSGRLPAGTQPFQPPAAGAMPTAPGFTPPTYKPPPAFEAPTYEQARDDPGFQFVQKEGQRGLENSAAARGLLYSGGTLKDIAQWNQGLADTQYQNVFNRNLNQYMTNYQTQFTDPYANAYKGALDQFNPQQQQWMTNMQAQQHANDFNYMNAYDQYKFGYQQWLDRIHESENLQNY